MSAAKALRLSITLFSTSADNQTLGWRLMRPKRMEDLAAFNIREIKRAAAEESERDEYSSAEVQCESKQKAKSSQRVFRKLKEGGRSLGRKTGEREMVSRIGR